MEPKKNPKKDVNRNEGIHFPLALALVLFFTYLTLEWKSYETTYEYYSAMNLVDELTEEVPITKLKTLPPPVHQAPELIEVAPDDSEILESIIAPTDVFPDQIIAIDSIKVEELVEDPEVLFAVIEDVPVFPGCENEPDKRQCFQTMMMNHIRKTFKYPEAAQAMHIQGKVYMKFVIQKDGNIAEIEILRSPHKNLGDEAARIIGKLPRMKPGKQRGNAVKVPFTLPITFKLE